MATGSPNDVNQDDDGNPYAPPQAAHAPEQITRIPFTVNDVFNWSWSVLTERMGTCLSIVWGVFAMNFMVGITLNVVQDALEAGVRRRECLQAPPGDGLFLGLCVSVLARHWRDAGHAQDRAGRTGLV